MATTICRIGTESYEIEFDAEDTAPAKRTTGGRGKRSHDADVTDAADAADA